MFKKAPVDESESTSEIPDFWWWFSQVPPVYLPQDLILSRLPSKHHKLHWLDWNQPTQSQSQCILSTSRKIRPYLAEWSPFHNSPVWVEWGRKIMGSPGRFCDSPPLAQHPGPRSDIFWWLFFAWKKPTGVKGFLPTKGWAMESIQITFLLLVYLLDQHMINILCHILMIQ